MNYSFPVRQYVLWISDNVMS